MITCSFFYLCITLIKALLRKIIYTTNLIENLNGKIRKYTKKSFLPLTMMH